MSSSIQKTAASADVINNKLLQMIALCEKGNNMTKDDIIKIGRKMSSVRVQLKNIAESYDATEQPSMEEANQVNEKMEGTVVKLERQVDLLVQHKPRVEELHLGGVFRIGFAKNLEDGHAFSKVFLEKTPESDFKRFVQTLEDRRIAAFKKAVDAYANSQGGEEVNLDAQHDSD